MTTAEAYESVAPIAIASARRVAPRRLRTDPDFLQDIRMRVWRAVLHAARRNRLDNLKPMGVVVGRNAATDHLISLRPLGFRDSIVHRERTPRITPHGDIGEFPIAARPEPDPFADEALLAIVDRADLDTAERVSVVLGFVNDRTHHEIAQMLRVSQPAAKRTRARALAKLKRVVA